MFQDDCGACVGRRMPGFFWANGAVCDKAAAARDEFIFQLRSQQVASASERPA